jgi:hypothetical protein
VIPREFLDYMKRATCLFFLNLLNLIVLFDKWEDFGVMTLSVVKELVAMETQIATYFS